MDWLLTIYNFKPTKMGTEFQKRFGSGRLHIGFVWKKWYGVYERSLHKPTGLLVDWSHCFLCWIKCLPSKSQHWRVNFKSLFHCIHAYSPEAGPVILIFSIHSSTQLEKSISCNFNILKGFQLYPQLLTW